MRWTAGWCSWLVGAGCLAATAAAQERPLAPGDERLDGRVLSAYSATWDQLLPQGEEWVARGSISEELSSRGGDRWVRVQRTAQATTEVELDRRTLRPISLRRTLAPGLPDEILARMAEMGWAHEIRIDFTGTGYRVRTTDFEGEETVSSGEVGVPFFDASTMGLTLAALRMEPGTVVRLPVLFVNGADGSVTEYWIDASAREEAETGGVESIQVDVGWLEEPGPTLTSAPGPDAAGGAYWVARNPARARAPVPRYKNESVDIVLRSGM